MIISALPSVASESYRLAISGGHQGIALALQSDFDGLRVKSPGVILEISRLALIAANLEKNDMREKVVNPVYPVSQLDIYGHYHKLK